MPPPDAAWACRRADTRAKVSACVECLEKIGLYVKRLDLISFTFDQALKDLVPEFSSVCCLMVGLYHV